MDSLEETIQLTKMLFEPLNDVVFCIKDSKGRYLVVNSAFVARAGKESDTTILGKTAEDVFAKPLAAGYTEQDREVLQSGGAVTDRLERIRNADGGIGWYLSNKYPLRDENEEIVGLISVSQDLHAPSESALKLSRLAQVVDYIRDHLDEPLRVDDLASLVDLSPTQFDRRMRKVFRLSTKQFVIKCRLEEASRLLTETDDPIGGIAAACGFADQSAFSRQFKATTGHTPGEFRKTAKSSPPRMNGV